MGRKPLYSTEAERKEAKKHRSQQRAKTKGGKELRSAQNRRAYERLRRPSKLRLSYQRIPAFMRHLTAEPITLTTQSLFDIHYYSKDPITDDDEFVDWELPPPYFVSNALLELGLEDTIDSLHGRRMRLQRDRERNFVVRYEDENREEMWKEVHLLIFRGIGEAKALKKQLDEIGLVDKDCIHYVMGLHLLRWKCYAINAYSNYWKLIRDGTTADELVDYFVDVWSAHDDS